MAIASLAIRLNQEKVWESSKLRPIDGAFAKVRTMLALVHEEEPDGDYPSDH